MIQKEYIHASFCTGIAACELASTWMGWTNAFSCEYANQKIIGET